MDFRQDFIEFALACKVLRFGEFKTKAGRMSPYFFNAGLFNDGASLGRLAGFYAKAAQTGGVAFDMLFGPAYKGIPLVAAIAVALAEQGQNYAFAFNRKESGDLRRCFAAVRVRPPTHVTASASCQAPPARGSCWGTRNRPCRVAPDTRSGASSPRHEHRERLSKAGPAQPAMRLRGAEERSAQGQRAQRAS